MSANSTPRILGNSLYVVRKKKKRTRKNEIISESIGLKSRNSRNAYVEQWKYKEKKLNYKIIDRHNNGNDHTYVCRDTYNMSENYFKSWGR